MVMGYSCYFLCFSVCMKYFLVKNIQQLCHMMQTSVLGRNKEDLLGQLSDGAPRTDDNEGCRGGKVTFPLPF